MTNLTQTPGPDWRLPNRRTPKPLTPDPGFPLHVLPPPLAAWLETTATITRVPTCMTALPFLALTGATIGTQLRLRVGPGWTERPALWVGLITLTGIGKTPAIAAVRHPFDRLHHHAWQTWRDKLEIWENLASPRPPRPAFDRLFATDHTIAGLTTALQHSTGLLVLRDELYGLVRTMDRRCGEDRQHYLTLWSSEPLLPTRHETASVIPNPVVGIVGGLQPALLHQIRRKDQDGFLERFLLVFVAGSIPSWTESNIAAPDPEPVCRLVAPLRAIPAAANLPEGLEIELTPAAAAAWETWFSSHLDLTAVASLTLGGFYRKMPSHLARLALILHTLWHPQNPAIPLSAATMDRAIDLVEYLRLHIHRTLVLFNERQPLRPPAVALAERTLDLLAHTVTQDGWITHTQLLHLLGRPETAWFNSIITQLITANLIETCKITHPGPGRPATAYRRRP